MESLKTKKGISMVTLVVTVVVLVILAGVSLTMGTNAIKTSKDSKLTSELLMVQHAVLEQYTKYQTLRDISVLVGNKMELTDIQNIAKDLGITLVSIPDNYSNKDYYRLDKASLLEIGIKDTDDEYIVNYVSGEVINITKKTTSDDNVLYVRGNSFYR